MRPVAPLIGAALLSTGCVHAPAVDDGLGKSPGCHPLGQVRVRVGPGQLDVDARLESELRRLAERARDAVHRPQELDGEVVGDHRAVEAPAASEQVGQKVGVRGDGHPVDLGVRVHDAAHPAVAHGHLERR